MQTTLLPVLIFGFCLTTTFAAEAPPTIVALKAARLFDGKSKTILPNGVVVVEGNSITAAGSGVSIPEKWDPLESTCRHASLSIL